MTNFIELPHVPERIFTDGRQTGVRLDVVGFKGDSLVSANNASWRLDEDTLWVRSGRIDDEGWKVSDRDRGLSVVKIFLNNRAERPGVSEIGASGTNIGLRVHGVEVDELLVDRDVDGARKNTMVKLTSCEVGRMRLHLKAGTLALYDATIDDPSSRVVLHGCGIRTQHEAPMNFEAVFTAAAGCVSACNEVCIADPPVFGH